MSDGFELAKSITQSIAQFGRNESGRGVTRLALTEPESQARALVRKRMRELGMTVRQDACLNLWGTLMPRDFLRRSDWRGGVVIGSHLDSVPEGGDYDGVLGVASGLGVVYDLINSGADWNLPVTVVVFTCEESSRFSLACVGSKAAAGKLAARDLTRFRDKDGVSLFDAIRGCGGDPESISHDKVAHEDYNAYFELHIEQGPVLENLKIDVGIVDAIAAPTRFAIELTGVAAHSGACPMDMRADALTAAAQVILTVEGIGRDESRHGTVATVGVCECSPGAMNVVPGHVLLKVDIRGIDPESIARANKQVWERAQALCGERGVTCKIIPYSSESPVMMDAALADRLERSCGALGVAYRHMPSGAGHDAMNMAAVIPSAMIFVPCRGGVSHNPGEFIEWERVQAGYDVLARTVHDFVC